MGKHALTFAVFLLVLYLVAIIPLVGVTEANPIISVYHEIPPPEGAQAPLITIHTPTNGSSHLRNLTLALNVAIPQSSSEDSLDGVTRIYYRADWKPNEVTVAEGCSGSFSVDLSDVSGGNHSVTIYAAGVGYNQTAEEYRKENDIIYTCNYFDRFQLVGHTTINFYKDLVPPTVQVLSPVNITYTSVDVPLDFTINEEASQIVYSLDGGENQTLAGNATLRGLANGSHSVILYVADLADNAAQPQAVFFSVNSSDTLFVPVVVILAVVVIVGSILSFSVYRIKHKMAHTSISSEELQ